MDSLPDPLIPDYVEATNEPIRRLVPALAELLSDLGRRAAFPPDIPFQAAEARGREFNATIGQITDGAGGALPVETLVAGLAGLEPDLRNRALLYSPVQGIDEVRRAWRTWQRRHLTSAAAEARPSTLPLATVGLTHGLSLVADLFAGPGTVVAVPQPFWGNYRQTFAVRRGAELVSAPAYRDGAFNPHMIPEALAGVPEGRPALAILNLPSNPGGYSPTADERDAIVDGLLVEADRRPLLVICDDAYAGLVYPADVPSDSIFWELNSRHEQLIPVKVDGATKEFSFFGGRVGFLTFGFEPESEVAQALESKVKGLVRAGVGSPVAVAQALLLSVLTSGRAEGEFEIARQRLAERYHVLRASLDGIDSPHLRPLPFNAGCFALLELSEALDVTADAVRRSLLDEQETGIVSIEPRYLRIAFCSVAAEALPEVTRRIVAGVAAIAK